MLFATNPLPLSDWLTYLVACPARYWREPLTSAQTLAALADSIPGQIPSDLLQSLSQQPDSWQLLLLISWLLRHPDSPVPSEALWEFCRFTLPQLAQLIPAEQWSHSPERQEELLRHVLQALGVSLADETPAQSQERLQALDSQVTHTLLKQLNARYERRQAVAAALKRRSESL